MRIIYPVRSCSDYDDKRIPSLWQMEKVAWRFSADNRKKTAGFLGPAAWKDRMKADGQDPDDEVPLEALIET
jgi:hypothetical protein